jgi:hypothetical protein
MSFACLRGMSNELLFLNVYEMVIAMGMDIRILRPEILTSIWSSFLCWRTTVQGSKEGLHYSKTSTS